MSRDMDSGRRLQVRPIQKLSSARKKFERVFSKRKRISIPPGHPGIVVRDLRRGCLESLEIYLGQERVMWDREVALELRQLIVGRPSRSHYRLLVVEHPDRPKSKGGRPSQNGRPSDLAFRVAEEFQVAKRPGQVEAAAQLIAETHGIKASTVYTYARMVAEFQREEAAKEIARLRSREASLQRREEALSKLREETSSH